MTESEWTAKICRQLHKRGCVVFAIVAQEKQQPGWPDRYVHGYEWHGWLEFKGAKTVIKLHQSIVMERLNDRVPGSAYVVRFPNSIQTPRGEHIEFFDGTGDGLLKKLVSLQEPIP